MVGIMIKLVGMMVGDSVGQCTPFNSPYGPETPPERGSLPSSPIRMSFLSFGISEIADLFVCFASQASFYLEYIENVPVAYLRNK